jgi:hypothetical protein
LEPQRIPALGAPAFRNPMPLQDNVLAAALAQMVAHGQSRLATTNDHRIVLLKQTATPTEVQ